MATDTLATGAETRRLMAEWMVAHDCRWHHPPDALTTAEILDWMHVANWPYKLGPSLVCVMGGRSVRLEIEDGEVSAAPF